MMDRSKYENTQIPENLSAVVANAIAEGTQGKKRGWGRELAKSVCGVAAFTLCVITMLNLSPVFAQAAYEIPVLGSLCRVFTFREYHFEDGVKKVDAKIPQISNTGKSELEQRINLEIRKTICDRLTEAEARADDYYQAFLETGGKPEDFQPIEIDFGYEVKCIRPEIASFVVYQHESSFGIYNSSYYYNIDLETGKLLTLRDCLGNDYRQIVAGSIENTIASWEDSRKEQLWTGLSVIDLISENTDFYINAENQVVVVIEKYAAAVGAAGTLEFVITP